MAVGQYLTVAHLDTKTLTRIFAKIRVDPATGCWLWTAALSNKGYGVTSFRCRYMLVHRLLYAWLVGRLPCGLGRGIKQLDHIVCDNRRCANPIHLKLVTGKANVLRGKGITAANIRKQCCSLGHPYTLYIFGRGLTRRCHTCANRQAREYMRRKHGFKPRKPRHG